MKMTILPRDDDITHVVLTGRLDSTAVEDMGERFTEATSAQRKSAIIDLSEVEFMASKGIGLLISNGKRLKTSGHQLVLLAPQGMVAVVLKTSGAVRVTPMARDLDEAIQILGGQSGQTPFASPPPQASRDEPGPLPSKPVSAAHSITEGELKLAIKNELTELEGLTSALNQFLDVHGVPHRAAYAVDLAVEELVLNVMRYAYVDDHQHLIEIELAIDSDQIILRIVDDGRPFDPRTGPSLDLHAEDREAGGMGLLLVLDMVDVLKYRRFEGKNWVEVRVHLVAEDRASDLPETGRIGPPEIAE